MHLEMENEKFILVNLEWLHFTIGVYELKVGFPRSRLQLINNFNRELGKPNLQQIVFFFSVTMR